MEGISRRDFIKTTSISAAGATMLSLGPLSSAFGSKKDRVSRVVIAKDEECYQGSVDQAKVQDMVDHAIMTLTGVSDKVGAYEALFTDGNLSTSSKILVKYNNSRPATTRGPVMTALKSGLTSMLNGQFPMSNITEVGRGSDNPDLSNQSFNIGSREYTIRQIWVDCDYFINMPSAWAISYTGVTLSLKGMMPAVDCSQGLGGMHDNFTSSSSPALSLLNSQTVFPGKQVLVLLDAISTSPTGENNSGLVNSYSVVASTDMVANDYQGLLILKENGLSSSNENTALSVLSLAAAAPYNLGTDDPATMEVLRISPPWSTELITSGDIQIHTHDIQIKSLPSHTIFEYPRQSGSHANLVIFDLQGRKIRLRRSSENSIVWNNDDIHGHKVSSGMYLYQLRVGDIIAQGKIALK